MGSKRDLDLFGGSFTRNCNPMNSFLQYGILGVFVLMIILEWRWAKRTGKQVYNKREAFANLIIMAGNQVLKPVAILWGYVLFGWVYPHRIIDLPINGWTFAGALVMGDMLYYWYHRLSHEIKVLWTLHHVHHSSPWMNFTTAFRINWLGKLINPLFFIPAILLGFSPEQVALGMVLNLAFQFFLHTESIGRISLLEGWLNTPSAHRVHHGSNEAYIDRNYGGILMIWDRIFGTYQAETEPVKYGVTTGFVSHNPLVVLFRPVWEYVKGGFQREREQVSANSGSPKQALAVRIVVSTLVACIMLLLGANVLKAQSLTDLSPEQRADTLTIVMENELGLSPEQVPAVHRVNLKYALKIQEEVLDKDGNQLSKMWRARSINQEKESEIKQLLSPRQVKLFLALKSRMQGEMKPIMMKALQSDRE